jgi:hypothetical protein
MDERSKTMKGYTIFRFVLGLILVGALIGLGVFVYNAGLAQGLAAGGQMVGLEEGAPAYAYPFHYGPFFRPWGLWPFGFFFPLLFVFLFFLAIRGLFFRGWRHHGPRRWHGWYGSEPQGVPPRVEEWHRKMHEAGEGQSPPEEQVD